MDSASADEASADVARRRLRAHGIVPIEPDDRIRVMLAPGELVAAIRRSVSLERRKERTEPDSRMVGDLYVTTRRLVYLARERVEYQLAEIQDAIEADGILRLIVGDRRGVEIEVPDPRLLRVEIAAVREAARVAVADAAAVRDEARRVRHRFSALRTRRGRSQVVAVARRSLRPIVNSQLVEDAAHVGLDRPR